MSVIFCLQHKNHHKVRCQERKCSETWNPLQTHLDAACQGAHGVLMLSKCFFSAQVCISEAFVTSSISEPYKTFHDLAMPQLWEKPDVCAAFLRLSLREQLWRLETAILNPYLCKWRHSSSLKGHRSINVLPCNHDLFFLTLRPISTSRLSDVIVTRGRNRGHFSTEAALKQSEHWSFGDGRDLTGFQSDIHLSSHSCRTPHVFVRRKCSISKRQFSNCLRRFKWKSMGRRMEDNSGVLENSGFTRGSYSFSDNDVPTSLTNHRGRKHWS